MSAPFTEPMARSIIESDDEPLRFERFCIDLFSKIDSIDYVPTSRTNDLGIDGRTSRAGISRSDPVLLISLRKDTLSKLRADLERIKPLRRPTQIRYCSGGPLDEKGVKDAKELIRTQFPTIIEANADGVYQLGKLAVDHADIFEKHYPGELANLRESLLSSNGDEDSAIHGLRVALTAQLTEDAAELRENVLDTVILEVLRTKGSMRQSALVQTISSYLKLPRPVNEGFLHSSLARLEKRKLIDVAEYVVLAKGGIAFVASRLDAGAGKLLEIRSILKGELLRLTGSCPKEPGFSKLFALFQEEIAAVFHARGLDIVHAISSVVDEKTPLRTIPVFIALLGRLSERIRELQLSGSGGPDYAQAVQDIFSEPDSAGFEWLCRTCMAFMSICSLGLESYALRQVADRLREIDLTIDTDILLSYLSEGERDHDTVVRLLQAWKKNFGRVLVSRVVLEEAAYHAWIAQRDYEEVGQDLNTYDDLDSDRFIENAFVRGYRKAARGKFSERDWFTYIHEFRGQSQLDHSRLDSYLAEDGLIEISEDVAIDETLAKRIKDALIEERKSGKSAWGKEELNFVDKARRDGELIAALAVLRSQARTGSVVVLSSSGLLRAAVNHGAAKLGAPEPVMPLSSLGYMLALCPGVSFGLGGLKNILFDQNFHRHMHPLDRRILRVLRHSAEYKMWWGNRPVLKRKTRERIVALSKERGEPVKQVIRMLTKNTKEARENLSAVTAKAIDEIARSEAEKEIGILREKLDKYERRRG